MKPLKGHVFINIPFDKEYERLYVSLIVGLVGLGRTPRSSLEVPATKDRLSRIFRLLQSCESSIHDLSRVQVSRVAPRCPRFNMPFEAGLAAALLLSNKMRHWGILEAVPHRLNKSLSDLNGYEHSVHNGSVSGMLVALTDFFPNKNQPDPIQLLSLYKKVRKASGELKRAYNNDLFRPTCFRQLVVISQEMARRGGYIR